MYLNSFDIICVKDLDVKSQKEKGNNNGMHRSINDCGFSRDRDYNASRSIFIAGREQASSTHRTKTTTSHISEASFGEEVGSRALQRAVVDFMARIISM